MTTMPKPPFRQLCLFLCACLFVTLEIPGQETASANDHPASFVRTHRIIRDGRPLSFTSTAGEVYLRDESGTPNASIWCVAYELQTSEKKQTDSPRPVTFVFNGGPGSASVWLHLGLLGPRLIAVDGDAQEDDGAAPYQWRDNPYFLIPETDLVFIDPVSTGFSRPLNGTNPEAFWGLMEDARALAQFIRTWITTHNRWQSPKYIIGESFGTTRAAAIAQVLEGQGQHVALNGLVLISQALDYAGNTSAPDNITSFFTYLPSMAATAWYHQKAGVGKPLTEFIAEARAFTYGPYLTALYRGNQLSDAERRELANRMHYFTGLSPEYLERNDLKVLVPRFRKELLRDSGRVLGQLDSRYTNTEIDAGTEQPHLGDPADYQIEAAFTAGINDYLNQELGVKLDRPYLTGNDAVYTKWNWKPVGAGVGWEPAYVNTAPGLAQAMRRNPAMRVLVATGYYDLITPFTDAEYTFSRHGFKAGSIEIKYYEAGHMMYNRTGIQERMAADLGKFIH